MKMKRTQGDLHRHNGQREGERHKTLLHAVGMEALRAKKGRMNCISNKTSTRQDRSQGRADCISADSKTIDTTAQSGRQRDEECRVLCAVLTYVRGAMAVGIPRKIAPKGG